MWSSNAFTERLNLNWPILQAPMGSLTTPALAAAVSNAGGIGGLGMWDFPLRMPNVALPVSGSRAAAA
jgi:nitronate monooxygenase